MALRAGGVLGFGVILLAAFFPETAMAERIVVGGSAHWTFGFNYTDWALKTAPFYQKDVLVFMYNPPNATTHAHSVYLMKNLRSFESCNFTKATMVGNITQGGGKGFEFTLKKRKPHYFACAERAGFHCTVGQMKFSVLPRHSSCRP